MNILWDVIEEWPKVGLAKGAHVNAEGSRCVMGILDYVGRGRLDYYSDHFLPAMKVLSAIAVEQHPERSNKDFAGSEIVGIVEFNNHPETSFSEMLVVVEKAAIRLDEQVA